MVRVLYISNLYPQLDNASSGVFVEKRLSIADKYGIVHRVYSTFFTETMPLTIIRKVLHKDYRPVNKNGWYRMINFKVNLVNFLRGELYRKFNNRLYESYVHKKSVSAALSIKNELDSNFDIIHAHGMYKVGAGIIAMYLSEMLGKPYVVTLHGSDVNYEMPKIKTLFLNVLKKASKVIFVSDALRKRAIELGYDESNSIVIPNGYDPEIFYPVDKIAVRKELGIYRKSTYYIGFVGNLIKVKRADKLGEIFHYIANKVKDVKFIVVGDGPLLSKVKKETKDLDIIFTGRLEQREVAKWMNAMDVMILPSRNEGFGAVVIEAQACGTAVVGSSNGGIPEAIGFNEFVVEEGEDFERRFADKVIEVLKNGYDSKILTERVKDYTWESIVRKEVEVYRNVNKLEI